MDNTLNTTVAQQHGEQGQESCLPAAESALEERLDHRVPVVKTVVIIPVIYGKSSIRVPPKMFNRVLITRAWAGPSLKWGTLKPFAALLSRSLTPIRLASRCMELLRPVRRSVK